MRRRSTYIPDPATFPSDDDFNPLALSTDRRRQLQKFRAVYEEKWTFGVDELPLEIADALPTLHQSTLHIRFQSSLPYNVTSPFVSALSPGLHVYFTAPEALEHHQRQDGTLLCSSLRKLFSGVIKCSSIRQSFTKVSSLASDTASPVLYQFYQPLTSLGSLPEVLDVDLCSAALEPCSQRSRWLSEADYLDIDIESTSRTLTVTVAWLQTELVVHIDASSKVLDEKIEVGILNARPAPADRHELQMEGVLAVMDEDSKLKPTMFSFASRHHTLPPSQLQRYTVAFERPTGLHPILQINFPEPAIQEPSNKPEGSQCSLYAYLTLPSVLFADEYAFPTTTPDKLFTESHNILALRSISGELDLEAPDYVIDRWGSALLLELAVPTSNGRESQGDWTVNIPLHLRYLPPNPLGQESSQKLAKLPSPVVFWACTADEDAAFSVNPFDRTHLGYDLLFGPSTMFYHLQPLPSNSGDGSLFEKIDVPVLNTTRVGGDQAVEIGTVVIILLGFGWIISRMWPALRHLASGVLRQDQEMGANESKKSQ